MTFPADFATMQRNVIDKSRLDADQDVDRIKDWLNSAYFTACIETNFYLTNVPITTPLGAESTSVAVPSGIVKIEYIAPTGSDGTVWGPMREVTLEELLEVRAWQGGVVSTGAPSRYSYRSSGTPTIEFWPQALGNENLTFYGASLPPPMVGDGEFPIIPEPYTRVIEYGALMHGAEFQKDLLMLQQFQQEYQDWLQRFRGFTNTRPSSQVAQLRVENMKPWPRSNSIDTGQ